MYIVKTFNKKEDGTVIVFDIAHFEHFENALAYVIDLEPFMDIPDSYHFTPDVRALHYSSRQPRRSGLICFFCNVIIPAY